MALLPERYNPVPVKILIRRESGRLDATTVPLVVIDEDFREPEGTKIYGSSGGEDIPVSTLAQVVYQMRNARKMKKTGEGESSGGHLTFRNDTWSALDSPIRRGDRIVEIAGFPVDLTVSEVRPTGHLASQGGVALLVMVFFEPNRDRVESVA